ncbi:nuclear transport factor 2 family protein [Sphingosinithalassobacter sp. CS137]|uniref:nuclear transport factor 2 family protein n=1 Tax=Sphingosinithalassobacter sp. CS137 TaxID=2762748 RepID=UPI001CB7078D|nr:nuclear transport factor 2 family protein [Sphingosinithalassobacter sp. CS137]
MSLIVGAEGSAAEPAEAPEPSEDLVDYDAILRTNLTNVFGERDPVRRMEVIRALYADNAVFYEQERIATGHEAISQAVTELLADLPEAFLFTAQRAGAGHHGLGRLQWRLGPPYGPPVATGTDVAYVEEGRIRSLHVFLDGAA